MRINYYGQMKHTKHNTRIMAVTYNDDEENLVLRIANGIEKTTPYRFDGFDNMIIFSVDDKLDFESLKEEFKEWRRVIKNCIKYGF